MTTQALPDCLLEAPEEEVLASLSGLVASGKIKPCRARSFLARYMVARSERTGTQYYASFEMARRWSPPAKP